MDTRRTHMEDKCMEKLGIRWPMLLVTLMGDEMLQCYLVHCYVWPQKAHLTWFDSIQMTIVFFELQMLLEALVLEQYFVHAVMVWLLLQLLSP
jgi:hypothetical protein